MTRSGYLTHCGGKSPNVRSRTIRRRAVSTNRQVCVSLPPADAFGPRKSAAFHVSTNETMNRLWARLTRVRQEPRTLTFPGPPRGIRQSALAGRCGNTDRTPLVLRAAAMNEIPAPTVGEALVARLRTLGPWCLQPLATIARHPSAAAVHMRVRVNFRSIRTGRRTWPPRYVTGGLRCHYHGAASTRCGAAPRAQHIGLRRHLPRPRDRSRGRGTHRQPIGTATGRPSRAMSGTLFEMLKSRISWVWASIVMPIVLPVGGLAPDGRNAMSSTKCPWRTT